MSTIANSTNPQSATIVPPRPLVAGDRLSRAEFERRYAAMPATHQAELIEGIVYMPSPVRSLQHGTPHARLGALLTIYAERTAGVVASDAPTIRMDQDNEPQPDLVLYVQPELGGNCRVSSEGYLEGAPELVAEISASSSNYDLHAKKNVYRRNGVQEYVVWRTQDVALDWFVLHESEYIPLLSSSDGVLKSAVLPGLWLKPASLLAGDFEACLSLLNQGLGSPEHAAFAQKLAAK